MKDHPWVPALIKGNHDYWRVWWCYTCGEADKQNHLIDVKVSEELGRIETWPTR